MNRYSTKYRAIVTTITWICILCAYPYIFNQIFPIPPLSILCIGITIVLYAFICINRIKLQPLDSKFNIIVVTQIIGWLIYIILHRDVLYIERIIYIGVIYLLILCLQNSRGGLYQFFERYDKFITYMAIAGTICFFLVLLLHMTPIITFNNKDGREAYFYILTSTNTLRGNIIRYAGYFDEPGAMAYWGIWALIFNKLFYNNKKIEKFLTICLVFTFSMAYYIQVFIYLCFFKMKSMKQITIMLSTLLIIGIGGYYISQKVPLLYTLTFARFEMSETGKINGDNRTELAEKAKIQFQKSPIIGSGISIVSQMEYMGDNPFETLAIDGILGTLITYLPFFFLFAKGNLKLKFAIIILFVGFLQRPFHHWLVFYLISYSFFILSNEKLLTSQTKTI